MNNVQVTFVDNLTVPMAEWKHCLAVCRRIPGKEFQLFRTMTENWWLDYLKYDDPLRVICRATAADVAAEYWSQLDLALPIRMDNQAVLVQMPTRAEVELDAIPTSLTAEDWAFLQAYTGCEIGR